MSEEERYKKYKQEYCKRCKNRTTDSCNIIVSSINGIIYTKCRFFEDERKD